MVSLASSVQMLIWLGPWLLPRVTTFYHSIRSSRHGGSACPLPLRTKYCLDALSIIVLYTLVCTLPRFAPPNILKDTKSRIQVPLTVLFQRLNNARNGHLTALDTALRTKYANASPDWILLYAAYGPEALAYCSFCKIDEPNTYLLYLASSVLSIHVLHVLLVGLITSIHLTGPDGAQWRLPATIAAIALTAVDITLLCKNDWKLNTTKQVLGQVDFFYWKLRSLRLLAFALFDSVLGFFLYLTCTKRWLLRSSTLNEQLKVSTMHIHVLHSKLQTIGQLQNVILRDDELRSVASDYWTREPQLMQQVDQERSVIDARRLALSRLDYDKLCQNADGWVDRIWHIIKPVDQTYDARKTQ